MRLKEEKMQPKKFSEKAYPYRWDDNYGGLEVNPVVGYAAIGVAFIIGFIVGIIFKAVLL